MAMKLPVSPEQQRTLAFGAVAAILGVIVYGMLVQHLWREFTSARRQTHEATQELAMLEAATAHEAPLRRQHEELTTSVTALRTQLPKEGWLPTIIELLSAHARRAQVRVQAIFPQHRGKSDRASTGRSANAATSKTYLEVPIQIDALASFHSLGTFLALVEGEEYPLQVSSLRITADPRESSRHNIRLVIVAFLLPED